jgi:hypothetical protein
VDRLGLTALERDLDRTREATDRAGRGGHDTANESVQVKSRDRQVVTARCFATRSGGEAELAGASWLVEEAAIAAHERGYVAVVDLGIPRHEALERALVEAAHRGVAGEADHLHRAVLLAIGDALHREHVAARMTGPSTCVASGPGQMSGLSERGQAELALEVQGVAGRC